MRSFEAAARHESYTMAAEELGVTQSAISRQVRELESVLGVTLFRRVGRAVRLSKAGHALRHELAGDLERLSGTINRAVAAGNATSLLSVAVLPTFATRWLVPRLPEFKAQHPGIELDLHSYTSPFSLEQRRIDMAIHIGQEDWPGAQLRKLFPEHLVVTAAPALLQRSDVSVFDMPLLHLTSRPDLWSDYHTQLGYGANAAFPGMRFDQFSMLISAAVAGLGAAILPSYLIEEELALGQLTEIDQIEDASDSAYYIATPTGQRNEAVQKFADWISRQTRRRR